jgi:hypothetical protein
MEKRSLEHIKPFRNNSNKIYVTDQLYQLYCQFNPIEMAWHVTKDYYNKHITLQSSSKNYTKDLWVTSLSQYTNQM